MDEINQEKLIERLLNRIDKMNTELLKDIARQIKVIGGLNPTKARQIAQMLKYGGNLDEIAKKISKMTALNVQDIYDIFEKEAIIVQEQSKKYYDVKGVDFISYESNERLKKQVQAIASVTASNYVNLSKTLAYVTLDKKGNKVYSNITQTYMNAIDEAVMSISQGKETFDVSFRRIIKQLSDSGLQTVDYASGYHKRLDSAVRMNIQDGIHNMINELSRQFGEEFGADGVEITVHENSAPDHIDVQGHQFTIEEFNNFQNDRLSRDYEGEIFLPEKDGRDRRSIGELNCYHDIFYIVLGVQKPNYTKEELKEINERNKAGFDYEGKHYTNYEGTQLQRKLETEIRKEKDAHEMYKIRGETEDIYKSQHRLNILSQKYKELSNKSGLPTKVERLKTDNYQKVKGNVRSYYLENLKGKNYNGIVINDVSDEINKRTTSRNVYLDDVKDTLINPLHKTNVKYDEYGRPSIQIIGINSTIAYNPESGTIITVWKTGRSRIKKYGGMLYGK